MKRPVPITTLFVDIGGVLLTNGWDHHARKRAARNFNLNCAEMEDRHVLNFAAHEEGQGHVRGIFGPRGLLPRNDRSPGPNFALSCSRNQNLTPR